VTIVEKVAGGMNGVLVDDEGWLHGAACWRADGVPIGISGGRAHASTESGGPRARRLVRSGVFPALDTLEVLALNKTNESEHTPR